MEKLSDLFGDERKKEQAQQAERERELQMLYAEIGKLSTQLNWLKKMVVIRFVGEDGVSCHAQP